MKNQSEEKRSRDELIEAAAKGERFIKPLIILNIFLIFNALFVVKVLDGVSFYGWKPVCVLLLIAWAATIVFLDHGDNYVRGRLLLCSLVMGIFSFKTVFDKLMELLDSVGRVELKDIYNFFVLLLYILNIYLLLMNKYVYAFFELMNDEKSVKKLEQYEKDHSDDE